VTSDSDGAFSGAGVLIGSSGRSNERAA